MSENLTTASSSRPSDLGRLLLPAAAALHLGQQVCRLYDHWFRRTVDTVYSPGPRRSAYLREVVEAVGVEATLPGDRTTALPVDHAAAASYRTAA